MNTISKSKKTEIITCLVEGNSIRATSRMTGASKNTIISLLVRLGTACAAYQNENMRNLHCKRIQCDEIWSFCYAKEKNLSPEKQGVFGYGDVWTWTAICADTKLVPSFMVGNRDLETAKVFVSDLASRLADRVQLTTDGNKTYLQAVEEAFGPDIDYAMLEKIYGGSGDNEKRYSPAQCIGTETIVIRGKPDLTKVSTSYVERANLTMRMQMRRFTRLTNAFSKKVENLIAAVSLHFMYYNYCRPHKTLTKANKGYPTTPAMAAGISDHVWSVEEIINLEEQIKKSSD